MNFRQASAAVLLFFCCRMIAQERGSWRAASKTADAITGDVVLAPERISINFATFPIAPIAVLKPAEIKAVFDLDNEPAAGGGNLYKLSIPAATRFVRKNTLCGGENVQWMVTFATGRELRLAFFSSAAMPKLNAEAMATTTELCGTYAYVR